MLSLSATTGYAVLALGCLSDTRDSLVMTRQIAECTGIPSPYLSKILNSLVNAGLVEGKRGYQGGYRLRRPAEELSLLELAEAVEGPNWLSGCFLGLDVCRSDAPCPAHALAVSLRAQARTELARLTVADMAESERTTTKRLKRCCGPEGCGAGCSELPDPEQTPQPCGESASGSTLPNRKATPKRSR